MNINTDQAFEKLKEAGVTGSIQTVRRWLRNGKIKASRSENRKAGFEIDEGDLKRFINERTGMDKDERIKYLEEKYKQLNDQYQPMYEDWLKVLKENRELKQSKVENEKLKRKIELLRDENKALENAYKTVREINDRLTKENESKNNSFFDNFERLKQRAKANADYWQSHNFDFNLFMQPQKKQNYRENLGLSSNCSDEELKKEFKKLLKILHPDTGGNAKLFQQMKADYDAFRKSI